MIFFFKNVVYIIIIIVTIVGAVIFFMNDITTLSITVMLLMKKKKKNELKQKSRYQYRFFIFYISVKSINNFYENFVFCQQYMKSISNKIRIFLFFLKFDKFRFCNYYKIIFKKIIVVILIRFLYLKRYI